MLQRKGYLRRDPHRPRAVDVRLPHEGPFPSADSVPVPAASRSAGDRAARAAWASQGYDAEGRSEPAFVPVVGRIAAGTPILAEQQVDAVFPLPREVVGTGELFMLRVVGDSMVEGGIVDGDWVVVRRQQVAEQGDVVAAMVDGEATVKRFYRRGGHVWLLRAERRLRPHPGGRGGAARPRGSLCSARCEGGSRAAGPARAAATACLSAGRGPRAAPRRAGW